MSQGQVYYQFYKKAPLVQKHCLESLAEVVLLAVYIFMAVSLVIIPTIIVLQFVMRMVMKVMRVTHLRL